MPEVTFTPTQAQELDEALENFVGHGELGNLLVTITTGMISTADTLEVMTQRVIAHRSASTDVVPELAVSNS